jgi:hypothetical protein
MADEFTGEVGRVASLPGISLFIEVGDRRVTIETRDHSAEACAAAKALLTDITRLLEDRRPKEGPGVYRLFPDPEGDSSA